nr:isoform 2 of nedd8-conjugating enzyme ubc12 [Quercus suber]
MFLFILLLYLTRLISNAGALKVPNLFLTNAYYAVGKMIKLFKVKEKQRELAENANGKTPVKKQSAGELRLHKDISELNLPKSCHIFSHWQG